MKAINAGDAIILSKQDLIATKKDTDRNGTNNGKEQAKQSTVPQDSSEYEVREQCDSFVKSESTVKQEAYVDNYSIDAPHLFKPVPSKLSSRSSRKQVIVDLPIWSTLAEPRSIQ
jgi:uncharacterized membrane protein YukC